MKEVMRKTLDELTKKDFRRFRHHLSDKGQITMRKLERACEEITVDSMVDVYTTKAGDIMLNILKKMDQNHLASVLERELGLCK